MWSSPLELYPIHVSPIIAAHGMALVAEPKTDIKVPNKDVNVEYLVVPRPTAPYEIREYYSHMLWIC
jgi:hypothetical protein